MVRRNSPLLMSCLCPCAARTHVIVNINYKTTLLEKFPPKRTVQNAEGFFFTSQDIGLLASSVKSTIVVSLQTGDFMLFQLSGKLNVAPIYHVLCTKLCVTFEFQLKNQQRHFSLATLMVKSQICSASHTCIISHLPHHVINL